MEYDGRMGLDYDARLKHDIPQAAVRSNSSGPLELRCDLPYGAGHVVDIPAGVVFVE